VVIGLEVGGVSRAYPLSTLVQQSPVQDRLGDSPTLLVIGPDGKSVRAFLSRLDGSELEFFRKTGSGDWALVDAAGGSEWNFRGCATSGPAMSKCLEPLPALRDFWFDWLQYHPSTRIYRH
jgi:hypothetical protein